MNEMGVHQDVREKVVRDAFKFMSENADYVIIHRAFGQDNHNSPMLSSSSPDFNYSLCRFSYSIAVGEFSFSTCSHS